MILFRQKEFVGLDDGFGGKKGMIIRSGKKSDAYKKFGPWKVELSDNADDDYTNLDNSKMNTVDKILEDLKTHPYQGSYGQHPLWEFKDKQDECVIWSAEINDKDRITYLIFKTLNYILVTNIGGHAVINMNYAVRPTL